MFLVNQRTQPNRYSVKILIIDSDASAIESLQAAFMADSLRETLPPFMVTVVTTAQEALLYCGKGMPDCILVANQLSEMSGLDFIRLFLAPDVRYTPALILMIGAEDRNVVNDALKLGVQDYVLKENTAPEQVGWTICNALERNRLRHQLMDKQHELETFAGQAAHDMISPLTNLSLSVEYLYDQLEATASAELSTTFDSMSSIVDYMSSIIDGLRNYAYLGRQCNSFSPTDLQEIFEYVELIFDHEIGMSGATIRAEPLPTLYGDKVGLTQLLQNLIGNALKYCGEETPEIVIKSKSRSTDWLISIADNGIGIDPADHEKIFEPFQRLHSRADYPGSGLGLSTCKKVVEQHRGRIWVESRPGQGTAFHVVLPKVQPEQLIAMSPQQCDGLAVESPADKPPSIDWDALLEIEVPLNSTTR